MTKFDIFISGGYVDKTNPTKYDTNWRYFMRLHTKDMIKILDYLEKKADKFNPVKEEEY